jgi:hypothetical protein
MIRGRNRIDLWRKLPITSLIVKLGFLFLCLPAFAQFTLDGNNKAQDITGSNITTLATPAISCNGGSGNANRGIAVWVRGVTNSNAVSFADTAGNTYTAGATFIWTGSVPLSIYYVVGAVGNASNVVTATFAGSGWSFVGMWAACAHAVGTVALDVNGATHMDTQSSPILSATFSTTGANAIVFSAASVAANVTPAAWAAGTGYTLPSNSAQETGAQVYKIVSTIQTSITAGITSGGGFNGLDAGISVLSFKESSGFVANHAVVVVGP